MRRGLKLFVVAFGLTACDSGRDDNNNDDNGPIRPRVVSTAPAAGATGVDRGTTISVTFSEPMGAAAVLRLSDDSSQLSLGDLRVEGAVLTATYGGILAANRTYTVTVPAYVSTPSGMDLGSDYVFSFTTGDGFTGAVPAPSSLGASWGLGSAALFWSDPVGADSYNVYVDTTTGVGPAQHLATYNTATPGYAVPGLMKGPTYYFVVTAMVNGAESPASPLAQASSGHSSAPAASSAYIGLGDGELLVSWSQTYAEDYFRLEWATDPALLGTAGGQVLDNLTATEHLHTGLANWTRYYYRVVAVNGWGDGAPSNVVSALPSPTIASLSAATDARVQSCLDSVTSGKLYAAEVESFYCTMLPIGTLAGLEQYRGIRDLILWGTGITSVAALANQVQLTQLDVSGNVGLTDLSPLAGLSTLMILSIGGTGVTDFAFLDGLIDLTSLSAHDTSDAVIGHIAGRTRLTSLDLGGLALTDLGPLAGLTGLTSLALASNPGLVDLTPLAGLTALISIELSYTSVDETAGSLGVLAALTSLETLEATDANIGAVLPDLGTLTNLVTLDLRNNAIADLAGLQGLSNLSMLWLHSNNPQGGAFANQNALGSLYGLTYLGLANNGLTSLLGIGSQASLTSLNLSSNALADVSALAGLTALEGLDLANNQLATGVDGLTALTAATYIDVSGNSATLPCPQLATLLGALGSGVVNPDSATAGVTCQ